MMLPITWATGDYGNDAIHDMSSRHLYFSMTWAAGNDGTDATVSIT